MKTYEFGKIMLVLRQEYMNYKSILDRLNNCVNVESEGVNHFFSGALASDRSDACVKLFVEKEYNKLFKRYKYRLYKFYAYTAIYDTYKSNHNLYSFKLNKSGLFDSKEFNPTIDIIDKEKFSNLVDELLSSDLMKLKMHNNVGIDQDTFGYDFGRFEISSSIGNSIENSSSLVWNGFNDNIECYFPENACYGYIIDILKLKVPASVIPNDLLMLLEKYDNVYCNDIFYSFDLGKNGLNNTFNIYSIDNKKHNTYVKLRKLNK